MKSWPLLFCLLLCSSVRALAAEQPDDDAGVETIEVTGERPGPRLWRVSKGDHVVWLLGTLDPLPKQMTWRSHELEKVLDEVKQVLPSEPDVDLDAGPITLVRTYFTWRKVRTLPDKQTLKDWLPAPLYARWAALRIRYSLRDDNVERQLPVLAGLKLYRRALDVSKLAPGTGIEKSVVKLARKHDVKVRQTQINVDNPRDLVTQVGEIPRASQIACLDAIVERLEKDIETIKAQANAWAVGDVATLRALPYPKEIQSCADALESSGRMKKIIEQTNRGWNEGLEKALNDGVPTLAVRPIYEMLRPNGTLDSLRAKGYEVEGP
jgi:uncharacterized protein YbaP (TraB family)